MNAILNHRIELSHPVELCPICKSKRITQSFFSHKAKIGEEGFALFLCKACEVYFCNPQPTDQGLLDYYDQMESSADFESSVKRYTDKTRRQAMINSYILPFQKYLQQRSTSTQQAKNVPPPGCVGIWRCSNFRCWVRSGRVGQNTKRLWLL